jgi:hypothetical protein
LYCKDNLGFSGIHKGKDGGFGGKIRDFMKGGLRSEGPSLEVGEGARFTAGKAWTAAPSAAMKMGTEGRILARWRIIHGSCPDVPRYVMKSQYVG